MTVNETVTRAALDRGGLTYEPPAHGSGSGYVSFTFKVSGSTETSDVAYSMTVDVTNVDDPPTGLPTISGIPEGRRTLTVSTAGIADVDGLTGVVYRYQWKRYAANGTLEDFEGDIGADSSTYTLTEGDVGKKVRLKLAFEDDGGGAERLFSAAFPPTGTVRSPVLVSTTEQEGDVHSEVSVDRGQAFTTGRNVSGYNVTGVTIESTDLERDNVTLQICEVDRDGNPTTTCWDLNAPTKFVAGPLTFNVPSDTPLTPASLTTYMAVFKSPGGENLALGATSSSAEDAASLPDWSMRHGLRVKLAGGWSVRTPARALRMTIRGTANAASSTGPTAMDSRVATTEDMPYTFTAADFNFVATTHGDTLASVRIRTLPADGTLALNGVDVTAAQSVTRTQLNAGQLEYRPADNGFGMGYAAFQFVVSGNSEASPFAYWMTIDVSAVNDAATGAPAISGTAQVGETLTASITLIADLDGLPDTFDYQWIRVDDDGTSNATDIVSNATSTTYTLTASEVGKKVKVEVSFTDNGGASEAVLSAAYPSTGTVAAALGPNTPPTALDGTVTTDEDIDYTFAASEFSYADIDDGDRLHSVKITGLPAAGKGTLKLDGTVIAAAALPKAVTAAELDARELTYAPPANAHGSPGQSYASFMFKVNDGREDSADEYDMTINVTSVNDAATGGPTISGTAQVGQTLTASNTGIVDPEGFGFVLSRQWIRVDADGMNPTNIGTDSDMYLLTGNEVGKRVKVKVNFYDTDFNSETVLSAAYPASGTVTAAPGVNNAPTAVDSAVTTTRNTAHTFVAAEFRYADIDGDLLASVKITALPGANRGTLSLAGTAIASGDLPKTVTANQLATSKLKYTPPTDRIGTPSFTFKVNDGTADSTDAYTMTINVVAGNSPATGEPTISGTAQVGQTLTASTSPIDDLDGLPSVFTYQWIRVDADGASNPADIGADSSTYTLTESEKGKKVKVEVSFTDSRGASEARVSAAYPSSGTVLQLMVSFEVDAYTVPEGGTQAVTVTLSADPERTVVIPLTATDRGSTSPADYSVPLSVTFNDGDTSQTITFTATQDADDDDGESVLLAFGTSLPAGVSASGTVESTVTITDDDDPAVTVSFEADAYTVPEGGTVTVTVELDADPERTVVIPLTAMDQGSTSPADYSVPLSVTFNTGELSQTITFTATQDTDDDDGESVLLGFGTSLPAGVSASGTVESTVTITDDDVPAVTVSFEADAYTVPEGGTQAVTVRLSADPERTVVIPLTATDQGSTSPADYSVPLSVTFNTGELSKTITFTATQDTDDDDGESVLLAFGTSLPAGVSASGTVETVVSIVDDDDPQVTVSFGADAYTVPEGGTQAVTVTLSADPERTVVIPLTATDQGTMSSTDYSAPLSVTFNTGELSKTITFTATQDTDDDDGESVLLGFGTSLPAGVSASGTVETVVSIVDDDDPQVTVSFEEAAYRVPEDGTVTVTIELSADPERTVVIPLTATNQGSASPTDYSVPLSVTFNTGELSKTITFTATPDSIDDDGESVLLAFGTSLPSRVRAGTTATTTVSIDDDDGAGVSVSKAGLTIVEGNSGTYTIVLDSQPTTDVTVTINDPSGNTDVTADPASVTFSSSDWSSSKTVTVDAAHDVDADNETATVTHTVTSTDSSYNGASASSVIVTVTDDDDPQVTVSFEADAYTVPEGGTQSVTVRLSADPERTVVIPLMATPQDGADTGDYSVPTSVTFNDGERSKTITFSATHDTDDDDGESVLLAFGTSLPAGVSASGTVETTVSITDDDDPQVTVSFEEAAYRVPEDGTVTVTVELSAVPERTVDIPLVATGQGAALTDYSVPTSVTFNATEKSTTITFSATHDTEDDDGESVLLAFGTALPAGVSAGTTATTTVSIDDDDDPQVTVSFEEAAYTVPEGGTVTVTVELDADPERMVVIPLTATNQGDAASTDYSVPTSVTFTANEKSQTIAFMATQDSMDDDGESVLLAFGTSPPSRVRAGTTATTTVSIDDDDGAGVSVSRAALTIDEGNSGTYTIVLDSQPTADVVVTINDPSGNTDVTADPASLTFSSSDWGSPQTVTVNAAHDTDAADETATVTHTVTSTDTSYNGASASSVIVTVTDDDDPQVTVSFWAASYTVVEGGTQSVTVTLSADPERTVAILITATPQGDADIGDYSVPASVTFNAGDTSKSFTFTAMPDTEDDAGKGVKLSFGTLPIGVIPGTIAETTVTITATTAPGGGGGGGGGGGFAGGGGGGPSPSVIDFEWTVERDIDELGRGHDTPAGAWSDGATLWVLENGDGADDAVYAYDVKTGERVPDREFELDGANRAPRGVWSDGSTAWVSDSGRNRLFAHDLETRERLPERDIALAERNRDARGIWSGDETMWVLDGGKDSLFAYGLASGVLPGEYELTSGNGDPHGVWSDGVTVWVSDHGAKRLFAYRLPAAPDAPTAEDAEPQELERVIVEEFMELSKASNNSPRGIWSDGAVMYVADESDGKVYTYNMPNAIDARLVSLSLSGVDIGEFSSSQTEYTGAAADGTTATTVEAQAAQRRTDVDIDPPDADVQAAGHQVALEDITEITVTVTSADGSRKKTYRVRLAAEEVAEPAQEEAAGPAPEEVAGPTPEEAAGPAPDCLRGAVAMGFSLVVYAGGSIENLVACAESRNVVALYALDGGEYVSYVLGAPTFVNWPFRELYADGVPALTPLTVRNDGPATAAPVASAVTGPWATCLQGEIVEGFNLVMYEGGSVDELEACAEGAGLAALYVLDDGAWVSYILGAPGFVNRSFRELFTDGLPVATPLVGKRD